MEQGGRKIIVYRELFQLMRAGTEKLATLIGWEGAIDKT